MTSGGADAHPLLLGGHDGALREFRTVTPEGGGTHRSLILRTLVHEPDDSSMWDVDAEPPTPRSPCRA